MQRGLVFNLQKYSVQDGPGIRTTVFLKGCPLCCAWCHNPEGIAPRRELVVVENHCTACGACRRACPFAEAFAQAGDGAWPTRNEPCTLCGACVEACPTGARQLIGRDMTVAEVMAEVRRDRIFYEDSGGGVTFSGGEPLLQAAFLLELLGACRAEGLRTAVDTCGFGCTEHLVAAGKLADLVLYDLKLMDDTRHRQFTGVSNRPILENLRALDDVHRNIWIRVPVIPGVNDDEASLEAIARFVTPLRGVRQINLLPFHKTGLQKARRLGHSPALAEAPPLAVERMQNAVKLFTARGLPARLGG